MDFPGNPRHQTSDALIRYNHAVNKQIFLDKDHMVTDQNTDSLNTRNVNQCNIHRASLTGAKLKTD